MDSLLVRRLAAFAAIVALPAVGSAQQAPATPTVVTPAFDFSGQIFGSYQFKTDSRSKANLGGKSPNLFGVDRAYLTFRMPAGDNGAIRITTDIFQNTNAAQNAYYQGWVVRLKYGYLQYTGARNSMGNGSSLVGRIGVLHTVARSTTPKSSGRDTSSRRRRRRTASSRRPTLAPPPGDARRQVGRVLWNGHERQRLRSYDNPGTVGQPVTSNRFKDVGFRFSVTPFANRPTLTRYVRYLAITPWYYKGFNGSAFQSGGAGQVGPGTNGAITDGLARDR